MTQKINREPIHCYGIITMIDALGTRRFTIEKCMDFFKLRQDLIKNSLIRWEAASKNKSKTKNTSKVKIYFQSFADTLVIAVDMKEFGSVHGDLTFPTGYSDTDNLFYGMWLERLAYVLGDLIRDAFLNKIVFRGAMSAGEFLLHEQSNSILGPAVVDVANHYEEFESIGVILTPHSTETIRHLAKSREPWPSLKQIRILFKNNHECDLYAVNWPNAFCKEKYTKEVTDKAIRDFYKILSEIEIPKTAEKKYESAKLFFENILKEGIKKK